MNPRERVKSALNHQEPDRIPIDLGGSICSSIHKDAYIELKKHLRMDLEELNMADYIRATENQKLDSAILEVVRDGGVLSLFLGPEPGVQAAFTGAQSGAAAAPGPNNAPVDGYTRATPSMGRRPVGQPVPPIKMTSPLPHGYWGVCVKCHEITQGPAGPAIPKLYPFQGGAPSVNNAPPSAESRVPAFPFSKRWIRFSLRSSPRSIAHWYWS